MTYYLQIRPFLGDKMMDFKESLTYFPHPGFRGVGKVMHMYVEWFHRDVQDLQHLSLQQIFSYVEGLPYIYDDEALDAETEYLTSPASFSKLPGLDCKKKAILIACWARCNKLPYRFLAINDTNAFGSLGITHVCAQVMVQGEWCSMDATISNHFTVGGPMPLVRYAEEI